MRSNICKIDDGSKDLAAILKESEKVAVYNELDSKQTLQLRLICEEVDGMLPNIVESFKGDFWIDFEDGICKINVSLRFEDFSVEKKDGLIGISKNKKNASATGVIGKIRSAIENVLWNDDPTLMGERTMDSYYYSPNLHDNMDYTHFWTLEQYRSTARTDGTSGEWDELEKSVIASIADDIIVGVKGKRADIIVVKKFA